MREVALIGGGNMGSAMLRSWIDAVTVTPEEVVVCDRDASKTDTLASELGVDVTGDIREACTGSRIVVLAVKPQDSGYVLEEIGDSIHGEAALLSIAAGVKIASIRKKIGPAPTVIRAMPNVAALVGAAVTAYAVEDGEPGIPVEEVIPLLMDIGEVVSVGEDLMDAVTAVSGSGPAYFFLMVESLQEAGVACGMSENMAESLARETLWGAARLLKETESGAADLRKAVTSPGGTTAAALGALESYGFADAMIRAVKAARDRSEELAS